MTELSQRVRVYKNLHKDCFSVQHKTPKGWRVCRHVKCCVLRNVKFIISQAGRARTLREGKKFVHAYIEGDLDLSSINIGLPPKHYDNLITYNPRKTDRFMLVTDDVSMPAPDGIGVYLGYVAAFQLTEGE